MPREKPGNQTPVQKAALDWMYNQVVNHGQAKQAVAREALHKFPGCYPSLELARSAIRHVTGAAGARNRNHARTDLRLTIEEGLARIKKEPREADNEVFLPDGKTAVLSDAHIPHHSPEALGIALETCVEAGCENIVLNGDFIDFYGISRWAREPGRMTVAQELHELRKCLDMIASIFPGQKIYKLGNHEERFRAFLLNNARELADMEGLSYESIFDREQFTIVRKKPIKAGRLNILHGHEFGESVFSPVNPARGLFLRAKTHAIIGHHHQTSSHMEGNMDGDRVGCWSLGCLCDLNPDYRPFAHTKWNHGFAIVEVNGLDYHVENKVILDGKVF